MISISFEGILMRKTCPKCKGKSVKLYRNQTVNGKRKWVPLMWYCTHCSFIYQIAANTLFYKSGEMIYQSPFSKHCPKCEKHLYRLYQHKNPKHGRQSWISVGWYCDRCKYSWIEGNP
jgi:DNA-directed RNA polymerase subunit M/transcription elongation factor TFIIS